MLKCLTLERILKYLDHFNHSLFYLPFKAARKLVISIKAQVCFLDLLISQLCDLLASAKLIAHLPIEFHNNIC